MVGVGVGGDVAAGLQQLHLYLQGGVGQFAQQLGLCDDLGGHQVQDQQLQGADVLMKSPVLRQECVDKEVS